ncbi:MAG: sulfotransferase domain-containing protein [Chloroflexota bacterium]
MRVIALVRDPTARALSHWNIRRRRGAEPRTFDAVAAEELALLEAGRIAELEAVRDEGFDDVDDDGADTDPARTTADAARRERAPAEAQRHGAYLVRGLYARQLERWAAVLPRERILVVQSERLFADPAAELPRVWTHLGLAPAPVVHPAHRNRRAYRSEPADPATIARVRDFFRPTYADLAPWLGRTPDWP